MYKNITEIKAANAAAGQFYFTPETMRFFNSRVLPTIYRGRYFITSEAPPEGERRYSVRRAEDDGSIITCGGFYTDYPTADSARHALYAFADGDEEGAAAIAAMNA